MEFTELFTGFAILLAGIIFIVSLTGIYNAEYGSTIGGSGQFATSLNNMDSRLQTGFVNASLENYATSTIPEEGQGTEETQEGNMLKRAWRTITNLRELVGIAPALIEDGAAGVQSANFQIAPIYVTIAKSLFWIVFSITLAYLLITGASRFRT